MASVTGSAQVRFQRNRLVLAIGGRELPIHGGVKPLIEPGRVYRVHYTEADDNIVSMELVG